MSAAPRLIPPCGLTQENLMALDERNRVPVVGGKCQNLFEDADGNDCVCGKPVGAHPSDFTVQAAVQPAGISTTVLLIYVATNPYCMLRHIMSKKYCMFLGDGITQCDIICAHLWPKQTGGLHLTSLGLLVTDVSNPRNFLRLHSALGKAFDRKRFYFDVILVDVGIRLVLKILDPSLKAESFSASQTQVNFASLDGQSSHHLFLTNRPFLHIIAKDAEKALLKAKRLCWIPDNEDLVSRKNRCFKVARLSLGIKSPILKALF